MSITSVQNNPPQNETLKPRSRNLWVDIASDDKDIEQCLRLRYRVFGDDMRARISATDGLDRDHFDDHCEHLLVRNETGDIVATTRFMTNQHASSSGRFYSETEFDLGPVLGMQGQFLEIGRTCVDPEYRGRAALPLLWQGIARLCMMHQIDYLIGCASIPLWYGDGYTRGVLDRLRQNHYAPQHMQVRPRVPLPRLEAPVAGTVILPPLLRGYLNQGAVICGEPHWDAVFNVADVFVLLDINNLAPRYARHFIKREQREAV
jgi:putative hemolysin